MTDRSRLFATTALALAVLATPASAQPTGRAKYGAGRNQDIKVNVKLSDRVKPSAPKTDLPKAAPEITADQVLSIEAQVGDIRKEQVQILDDLIEDCKETKCDVDEAADLYFRKAELHAQQQRFYRLKTQEFAIKADTAKKPADKANFKKQSDQMGKNAQTALINAVKVYKALADNDSFRNYSNMPKALFFYGYTLQSGKYMKEAREVYDKLLKNYPQSPYVPEAHLAFADYHFENNQLADAESRYKRVLQFPKSSVYWYAMYKMGWVHLNLGRHQEALEVFYNVAMATKNDKKKEILNRAAKKDIVRAYAEVGNVQKAYNYFQKVDKNFAFDMYQLLGDFFTEQGKSEKGIYVFRDLVGIAPKNKNVCLWQYNVAHLMLTAGQNTDKVEEIEKLVKLYGVLKNGKTLPPEEMQECHDNAAAMAGELARAWHSESAKTKNPETLAYAEKLYKVYLEVFTDAEDYAETQYYYSELIWSRAESEKNVRLQTELWENAAVAFTDVVKTGKVDARLMKESAYAAVLAWKNALNVDPRVKAPPPTDDKAPSKVPAPQEIPAREVKMMAAFDVYINYIKDPKDADLVGMKFLKANIYRRYNHFDEATPIFQDILHNHRQHETAEYSANLLLDTFNRQQKYDELVKLAKELTNDKAFLEGKEDLKERLVAIENTSLRKAAEKLETDAKTSKDFAKYVECGKAYSEIYNRDTEAAGSDEVLYNAAVCFEDGKSVGLAISMYKKLEEMGDTARKDIRAKAVARLGVAYSRIAYYGEAAKYLELYYSKYAGVKGQKDLKDAKDALSDAVFYRKGIGDDQQAIKNTTNFVANRDAKASEKAEAYFSLYAIYEKQGDTEKMVKHLRDYIGKYKGQGGQEKLVMAYAKIGMTLWQQSCPAAVKTVDGSCIKVERQRAIVIRSKKGKRKRTIQTQCGPESKVKVIIVKRDERKMKDALAAFAAAAKAFDGMKSGGSDEAKDNGGAGVAAYWAGMAKFYLVEPAYENYLGVGFPANLNFDPKDEGVRKKSLKRFDEWYAKKDNTSKELATRYRAVMSVGDASFAIAAAARIGQVAQNASDALFTAEIPENIRKFEEAAEIYCDTLMDKAEPLEAFTVDAFTACIDNSTKFGYFSEWSKLCERELGQIQPDKFPTASELRGDPIEMSTITDVEPPTIKLEQ